MPGTHEYTVAHVDTPSEPLEWISFEDEPWEENGSAATQAEVWAEDAGLNVVEVDADTRTIIIDTEVGDCDGCEKRAFLVTSSDVVLGDGSVDDTFKFCRDCTDSDGQPTADWDEAAERREMDRIEQGL